MKKRMMVLAALALSMTVSAAAWAGTFDDYYDYRNEDGTYSYYFTADDSQGLFVTMDQEWYQNTFYYIDQQCYSNRYYSYKNQYFFDHNALQNSEFYLMAFSIFIS